MKTTRTTEELDSLLGRGSVGATRRDAILAGVLAHTAIRRRAQSRWRWPFAGLATVAAAAAGLFLLAPRLSSPLPSPPQGGFRAKGGATPAGPSLAMECFGASLSACPTGSRLIFSGTGVRGFLSAWAEPVGGGERIWYFAADTVSPAIDPDAGEPALATRAVKVGPEHAAGSYRIEVRLTERPMARTELLQLSDNAGLAREQFSLTVTSP